MILDSRAHSKECCMQKIASYREAKIEFSSKT